MVLENGAAPFKNGCSIFKLEDGAAPFKNGASLKMEPNKYIIDLKYQKGSEMHTSDALSRLHNLTDTPDNKDAIPLNFLHFTPNYIEHAYSHWVENLYVHKTKYCDMTQVKRKHGRPLKQKTELDQIQKPVANTCTT